MKKIYMTMVALLCGVAAMAQVANLDVPENVEAATGSEGEITVGMTCNQPSLAAVSFRIGFPEGVAFATYEEEEWSEELEEMVTVQKFYIGNPKVADGRNDFVLNDDRSNGHTATPQFLTGQAAIDYPGFVQVAVAANPTAYFTGMTGDIITMKFQVAESVEPGDYTITINKAAASTKSGKSVALEDVTVPLTITKGTGIHSINADDVNAPIYNVAGQRVSKAQKGVFIQNGKKVAVK